MWALVGQGFVLSTGETSNSIVPDSYKKIIPYFLSAWMNESMNVKTSNC